MNEDDVLKLLAETIEQAGNQKKFAQQHNMSEQFVSDVLRRRRQITDRMLAVLGLERVVTYRRKADSE